MIKLTKLQLQNVVTYKSAVLPLDQHKLVRVSGQNFDEGSRNASNASGKSLLFTTLGSVLLNFVRSHASKGEKNTLVAGKESSASVFLTKNTTEYKITQYFHGSAKWEIEKNGKKLEFRKAKNALAFIRNKILNVSEQQFYSQVVVDGRTKSVLQSGTSTQRFDFFEDIFKLNVYDRLAEQANNDYVRIKRLMQEAEVLTREHNEKQTKLPEQTKAELEEKSNEITKKFNKIRDRIDAILPELTLAKTYIAVAEANQTKLTLAELKEKLADVETEEVVIRKLQAKAIKYQEASKLYHQQTQKRNELKTKLDDLPEYKNGLEFYQKRQKQYLQKVEQLQAVLDDFEQKQTHNIEVNKSLRSLQKNNEKFFERYGKASIKTLQRTMSNNKVELRNLRDSVASLKEYVSEHQNHDHSVCPTCLRSLTPAAAKQMLKTATDRIGKCKINIQKLVDLLVFKQLQETLQPVDDVDAPQLEAQIGELRSKIKTLEKTIKNITQRENLLRVLESLPEPTPLGDRCPDPSIYDEQIEGIRKRAKILSKAIQVKLRLRKLNLANKYESVEQAQAIQLDLEEKLNNYRPLIDKAQKILSNTNNKLSMLEMVEKDVNRLQAALDDLAKQTKHFKVYEALRKAFGPKGLRKIKTMFYATKLEANLNKYSHLIFNSPIRFKINVSNTKLDILAERNGRIDDVRSLSGAESSKFTLLLIVCILPFIPESQRFNLVALDEVEIGLDDPGKELFVKKYLPVLCQIVQNVFIITPASEQSFYIPNVHKYEVTKRKNVSTLKEA